MDDKKETPAEQSGRLLEHLLSKVPRRVLAQVERSCLEQIIAREGRPPTKEDIVRHSVARLDPRDPDHWVMWEWKNRPIVIAKKFFAGIWKVEKVKFPS
jgi:hypothetical protein